MDADSLPDIAQLLTASVGPSTRAATCTAIAGCSVGEAGKLLRRQIGTTTAGETIIRRLLTLTSDPTCARLALSALVNISEDEEAAHVMIRCACVERCAESLMDAGRSVNPSGGGGGDDGANVDDGDDAQSSLGSLYSGLLSNLTRFPAGVDALVGKGKGHAAAQASVHTLFVLVSRIDTIENVLWMSNTCSTPEGRAALLLRSQTEGEGAQDEDRQPLTWLLRLLYTANVEKRLAAASAVRNCAMATDCHDVLVWHTNALGVCLASLIRPRTALSLEDVRDAPREVTGIVCGERPASPENVIEIRLLIVESLLLLCKSLAGRTALRERDAYLVLHEWNKGETDEGVRTSVLSILQRIVAEEDGDEGGNQVIEMDIRGVEKALGAS